MYEALAAGQAWRTAWNEAAETFTAAAWDAQYTELRSRLVAGVQSFWVRLFGKYREASAELSGLMRTPLPKAPSDRLALVDQLIDVQNRRKTLTEDEPWLQEVLGASWRGERTDFHALELIATWLKELSPHRLYNRCQTTWPALSNGV